MQSRLANYKWHQRRELKLNDIRVRLVNADIVQCVHSFIDGTITLYIDRMNSSHINHFRLLCYADALQREGFSPKEVRQRVRRARRELFTQKYKFKTA